MAHFAYHRQCVRELVEEVEKAEREVCERGGWRRAQKRESAGMGAANLSNVGAIDASVSTVRILPRVSRMSSVAASAFSMVSVVSASSKGTSTMSRRVVAPPTPLPVAVAVVEVYTLSGQLVQSYEGP